MRIGLWLTFAKSGDKEKLFKEVKRVLKSNGVFIVLNPDPEFLLEAKRSITTPDSEMNAELSSYFEVDSFKIARDLVYVCRV